MSKTIRPPTEVINSIAHKAAAVRDAANALNERISDFEAFLGKLPGRVEAFAYGGHPDTGYDNPISLGLRLHREGKEWILSWCTWYEHASDPENPPTWKQLQDAPLKIKMAAVKIFPDLLEAIDKSQDELVGEINTASIAYDDFAKTLNAPKGSIAEEMGPRKEKVRELVEDSKIVPDELSRVWEAFVGFLVPHGPALTGVLSQAKFIGVKDDIAVVRLNAQYETFASRLIQNGKMTLMQDAMSKALNRQVGIRFEVYDPTKPALQPRKLVVPSNEGK